MKKTNKKECEATKLQSINDAQLIDNTQLITEDINNLRKVSDDTCFSIRGREKPLTWDYINDSVKKVIEKDTKIAGVFVFLSPSKPTSKKKPASTKKVSIKTMEKNAKYEERVMSLRTKGWCSKSIANMLHADVKKIDKILRKHGIPSLKTPKKGGK